MYMYYIIFHDVAIASHPLANKQISQALLFVHAYSRVIQFKIYQNETRHHPIPPFNPASASFVQEAQVQSCPAKWTARPAPVHSVAEQAGV